LHFVDDGAIKSAYERDWIAFGSVQCGLIVESDKFSAVLGKVARQGRLSRLTRAADGDDSRIAQSSADFRFGNAWVHDFLGF